jgi:hypothetical protein
LLVAGATAELGAVLEALRNDRREAAWDLKACSLVTA